MFELPKQESIEDLSGFVWGPFLLIPLLLLTGLYLSVLLQGIQLHRLPYALWMALVKRKEAGGEGDVSHYQALSIALAATVGVGNIAGVGTAIAVGGPGALFWMWMTGLVGMATKYSEAFLGVKYRTTNSAGEQTGGPMYYLSKGIRSDLGMFLAMSFAFFGIIASFGIGNMTQSNSVTAAIEGQWDVSPWISGLLIAVLAAVVILGGVKSIGRVASAVVPLMIILYVVGGLAVIAFNAGDLPGALGLVFTDAFSGTAATGGFVGAGIMMAIRQGVARGIFSNESGLGTGGIAAAAAKTTQPVRQGLVSMTQTFIDTLVVVTFTGLVIILTGAWKLVDPEAEDGIGYTGAELTRRAFTDGLPGDQGGLIVTFGLIFFAFSTLLGWAYYGERCLERFAGEGRRFTMPVSGMTLSATSLTYRVLFIVFIYVGAVSQLDVVWLFSDIMNGLMALPNLIGLLVLSPLIYRETKAFFARSDWKLLPPVETVSRSDGKGK
ncbi:MAG: alanine/glycine:cation symporter family protein [Stackebrandtia sp.]